MDWLQNMNYAIGYIEANLDDEIDLVKAGKIAGCTLYHFQRVFSYMANTTVAEYIRRRRLTRAAFDLQNSGSKVIDVAERYKESPQIAIMRRSGG
jgi:AraC family transcriptional regulator